MTRFKVSEFYGRARLLAMKLLAALFFLSCQSIQHPQDEIVVARVYDNYLYLSDLAGVVAPGTLPADSAQIVSRFIDSWTRQQAVLHVAMQQLDLEKMHFDKKIQDYKNSLLIFAYETELVKNHLDTIVSEDQIIDYYEAHKHQFKLQENIVKVQYVKVPKDAPDVWRLRTYYRSSNPDDFGLLEEYCIQHAASYFIEGDTWLLFRDLLQEIPIQSNNHEAFLRSNKYVELTDEYYRYFLNINDFKLIGSESPLVFERENIKSILLNRRKHAFINEQRNEFLQRAISDGGIESFL
jgi:hypothetical protein